MARTTLQLADDALGAARAYAERHGVSLGEAVSELVRQGAERPLVTIERNGLRVPRLGERSPRITSRHVEQLDEEW